MVVASRARLLPDLTHSSTGAGDLTTGDHQQLNRVIGQGASCCRRRPGWEPMRWSGGSDGTGDRNDRFLVEGNRLARAHLAGSHISARGRTGGRRSRDLPFRVRLSDAARPGCTTQGRSDGDTPPRVRVPDSIWRWRSAARFFAAHRLSKQRFGPLIVPVVNWVVDVFEAENAASGARRVDSRHASSLCPSQSWCGIEV